MRELARVHEILVEIVSTRASKYPQPDKANRNFGRALDLVGTRTESRLSPGTYCSVSCRIQVQSSYLIRQKRMHLKVSIPRIYLQFVNDLKTTWNVPVRTVEECYSTDRHTFIEDSLPLDKVIFINTPQRSWMNPKFDEPFSKFGWNGNSRTQYPSSYSSIYVLIHLPDKHFVANLSSTLG